MDPERLILLQSDIQQLKVYYHSIDDELLGKPVQFFHAINKLYKERLNNLNDSYPRILAQPFDFTIPDSVNADYEKRVRPADSLEQSEFWRKKMKYMALEKMVELQETRDKAADVSEKK